MSGRSFVSAPAFDFTSGGGGGGEANTASNIGTGTFGWWKQKVGVDLQFRSFDTSSSKLSLTLDDANSRILFDVVPGNITLSSLGGTLALSQIATEASQTFVGRNTAGTGSPEVLTVATAKTMLSLAGSNTGDQTITLTGDVSGTGTGSFATTLATVTTGKGGTGLTSIGTANQVLGANAGASGLEYKSILAGANVTVTHGVGTVTIASSGGAGGYSTVQEEGTPLTQRGTLNFIGAAITAADNSGSTRTDITLSQSPASASVVGTGRTLNTTSPITGGGDLTADRTFALSTVPTTLGGTGLTAIGTADQILATNHTATGLEFKTLGSGTNTSVTAGAGTLAVNIIASPAFTGTPTSPTAAVDTNTTQLATTGFVIGQAASANPLMDGSVSAGTATRFARADHVHPTDTSRAPTASPAFTGTPTAPTAATTINNTQLATTAFVNNLRAAQAGPNTIYLGAPPYNVVADGSTDWASAISSAISALGSDGGQIIFPSGRVVIKSGITIAHNWVQLVGAPGRVGTLLTFSPTGNGTAVTFANGASELFNCGIRDITIVSSDTTFTKTALKVRDASHFIATNVWITGFVDAGGTSVGADLGGREYYFFRDVEIDACSPMIWNTNPNSTISMDVSHFENLALSTQTYDKNALLINDNVNVTRTKITSLWTGGGGVFWHNTTSVIACDGFEISGYGWETFVSRRYAVDISNTASNYRNLRLSGLSGGSTTNNDCIKLRGVANAVIGPVSYTGTGVVLNADSSVGEITLEGISAAAGSATATMSGMSLVAGSRNATNSPLPSFGVYTSNADNRLNVGSINNVAFSAPASLATIAMGSGKTLTIDNSLELSGTDGTTHAFPSSSSSLARIDAGQSFTGTQTFLSSLVAPVGFTSYGFSGSTSGFGLSGAGNVACYVGSNNATLLMVGNTAGGRYYDITNTSINPVAGAAGGSGTLDLGSTTVTWRNLFLQTGIAGLTPTGTNTAGTNLTIAANTSTGTAAGGDIVLSTAPSAGSSSTANVALGRFYVHAQGKAFTSTVALPLIDVALPAGKMASGTIDASIQVGNGTDFQHFHQIIEWSAVNKGGVFTTNIVATTGSKSVSSGTLTTSWTVVNGTNKVTLTITPTTSLTPSGTNGAVIYYTSTNNSEQVITPL